MGMHKGDIMKKQLMLSIVLTLSFILAACGSNSSKSSSEEIQILVIQKVIS